MIDVPTFLTLYPEFKDATPVLLNVMLTRALQYTNNVLIWGTGTGLNPGWKQEGTFLHMARFLALSPFGRNAKLSDGRGRTNYDEDLRRLVRKVTSGYRWT